MSNMLRLLIKENATPPDLYRRILDACQIKRASSDLRALAMIAIHQKLEIELMHESYIGDTQFKVEFSLGPSPILTGRLQSMSEMFGITRSQALIKLVIAGWFYKTNPKTPATPVPLPAHEASQVALPHTEQASVILPMAETNKQPPAAQAETQELDSHTIMMQNQMMDSLMNAFG